MDETKSEIEDRSETLLDKITRFATAYTRAMHYLSPYHVQNDQARDHDSEADRDHSMAFVEDTVVFTQGEESGSMYYIQKGSVGIYTDYGTENEKLVVSLGGRTFFGEMGLIEKLPRKATAVILEDDTILREITEENLLELYERTPEVIIGCMQHMASRMRNLTRDYLASCEMIATIVVAEKEERKLTATEKEKKRALIEAAEELCV
jgi:CRP-like cAMP-binding protein